MTAHDQVDGTPSAMLDARNEHLAPLTIRDDQTPSPPSPSSPLSGGAIGGIIACATLSILLILLGIFIWHRRDRNQKDSPYLGVQVIATETETSKGEHTCDTGPVVRHTPSLPALPPLRIPSPSDSVMISVSPIESNSDGHGERGFTCSSSSSDSRTRLVSQSGRTGGERGIACTESSGSSSGAGPPEFLGRGRGDVKIGSSLLYPPAMTFDDSNPRQSLRPLPTPRTALNDNLQYRSSMPDFRHMRMHVDGRLQDFGPVLDCPKSFFAVSNPDTESEHDDDLPPDYDQATQPFPHSIHGSSPTVTPSSHRPPLSPWGR